MLRLHALGFAEAHEGRFVRQQELEHACQETGLARDLAYPAGFDPGQREKARQKNRVAGHMGERRDGKAFGAGGIDSVWFRCLHDSDLSQPGPGLQQVADGGLPFVNQMLLWLGMNTSRGEEEPEGRRSSCGGTGRDAMVKKVMIVEDNELNMKLFRDLIEASGYETVRTRNGLEALDLARAHKPDLILMDIQLPEVSGLEVTKWLKEDDELHPIPVIAVTAFAMKGDEERIRQGGCEAYISKPISVGKFIETIKSYLGDA